MATLNPSPAVHAEIKSSKKKKVKAEGASTPTPEVTQSPEVKGADANGDGGSESAYIRELQKFVTTKTPEPQITSLTWQTSGTSAT